MSRANVLINNMNTGEVSPLIESRSDLAKYAAACKTLENGFPLVEGGVKKMPGTIFAGIAANGGPLGTATTGKSRLVPFEFSTNQTAVVEFYAGGCRFWINGGLVLGSASGLSDWAPSTSYATAAQVLLGSYTRLSTTSTPSNPYLTIQASYVVGSVTIPVTLGVNSSDNLSVTLVGGAAIQILLANTTSSKNSSAAIQSALQALNFTPPHSLPIYPCATWLAYWEPVSSTPPITSVTVTQSMAGHPNIYQSLVGSNHDNFPPLSPSDWESIAPNVPIVVATPYAEADLFDLDVSTQSADVLYICHSSYPPATLSRYSNTSWVYQPLALYGTSDVVKTGYSELGRSISSITQANPAVLEVASVSAPFYDGQRIYINLCSGMVELNQGQFIVTNVSGPSFGLLPLGVEGGGPVGAVSGYLGSASFPSSPSGTYVASGGHGTALQLTVDAEPYMYPGGYLWQITNLSVAVAGTGYEVGDTVSVTTLFGYIVSTQVTLIVGSAAIDSSGFLPYTGGGFAVAIPDLFVGTGNYPACVTLYQQRLCLAGATNTPTQMNGSVQGDYSDFICDPNETDYAIQFSLVSQQVNPVRWMIGAPTALMLGTTGGVWAMFTTDGQSLSQTDVTAALQTTIGTGNVAPQLVNADVIWITRSARIVRLLTFNFVTNQWEGPDLTRLNQQITQGPTLATSGLVQTSFQSSPYPIFWAVRADGQLIGLTYERSEEVFAWFRVVTDGVIESVACVSQDDEEDQLWVSVLRAVNGVQQRYIEYFAPQELFNQISNSFFVHCGLQFHGVGPFTITGITNANPAVVTAPGHTLTDGEAIGIADVLGMTQANTNPLTAWTVTGVSGDTFELQGIDSTGWGAYTSGGTVQQVTNQVTGMSYLMGKTVVAIGDNQVIFSGIVTADTVVFGSYANLVTIGLPYKTTIEPMNPIIGTPQATSKGKKQKFSRVTLSLYESVGGLVGTDAAHLHSMNYGSSVQGNPPTLFTGNITRDLDGDWTDEDTIMIVHGDPFPFTLRSVVPRLSVAEEG